MSYIWFHLEWYVVMYLTFLSMVTFFFAYTNSWCVKLLALLYALSIDHLLYPLSVKRCSESLACFIKSSSEEQMRLIHRNDLVGIALIVWIGCAEVASKKAFTDVSFLDVGL